MLLADVDPDVMRRVLLAALLALGACGHTGQWDMSVPFSADFDQLLTWSIAKEVPPIFGDAVQAMGGTVSETGPQRIHFRQAMTDTCEDQHIAGYVSALHIDTIWLCPSAVTDGFLLRFTIFHELGHALGQLKHRECESKGLMAPAPACSRGDKGFYAQAYQPGDRAWICSAGGVVGARCSP